MCLFETRARGRPKPHCGAPIPGRSTSFGISVAVSGDTVVVGASSEDSSASGGPNDNNALSSGAAYVFVRTGTSFGQQAFLKADNAEGGRPVWHKRGRLRRHRGSA